MNRQHSKTAWLQCSAVLLICMAFLTAAVGTAYARFRMDSSKTLQLTYESEADQVYIRAVEKVDTVSQALEVQNTESQDTEDRNGESTETSEAEKEADSFRMEFVLSNGTAEDSYCKNDQTVTLLLFATIGLENPENFTITLTDDWTVYEASCRQAVEGSAWYSLYGPGWIYSFCNEAGEEITWHLSGTRFIEKKMVITIEGESELPAALNLIANARPGEY